MRNKKNIVVIGGGTGTFTVLSGLKKYPVNLSAVVSMADDGGSTGRLRDELGVLPPGDVRQCLVGLSSSEKLRDLFNYRFGKGSLAGHSFGNLFISALEQVTGSFDKAIEEVGKILAIQGQVIPVTLNKVRLQAILKNGRELKGEHQISSSNLLKKTGIKKLLLIPRAKANQKALKAIEQADLIIIGPGDLYCSIVPNFLVQGLPQAIGKSKAKKIYICNLMTKKGHTDNFSLNDFVETVEKYLGQDVIDFVIFNTKKPAQQILNRYTQEGETVRLNKKISKKKSFGLIGVNLLSSQIYQQDSNDRLRRSLIRHHPDKLAKVIMKLLENR